jgi:peroxiredoxin
MAASELPGPKGPRTSLATGRLAPDFCLYSALNQIVRLRDFRGAPIVLVFYPADWEPVSVEQLAYYQELLPEFRRLGGSLIGVSVDGVWCHHAFARALGLEFPLLADFEPKGRVAQAYGVYHTDTGTSERALFIVDSMGMICRSYRAPLAVDPGADIILTALEALTVGGDRPA